MNKKPAHEVEQKPFEYKWGETPQQNLERLSLWLMPYGLMLDKVNCTEQVWDRMLETQNYETGYKIEEFYLKNSHGPVIITKKGPRYKNP